MARGNTWSNKDGLVVGFGTHSEDNDIAASKRHGSHHVVEMEITLSSLADTYAATNRKPQEVIIPRGSLITNAYLLVKVAATGSSSTMDIGTWGVNDVVDDADGLVAAVTIGEMDAAGEVHVLDGALVTDGGTAAAAGVVTVGATSDSDVVIAPSYNTSAFTAGVVLLHVEYVQPFGSTGGTIAN